MDPVITAFLVGLIVNALVAQIKVLSSVTDREIEETYQAVKNILENLKVQMGDEYKERRFPDPQTFFQKFTEQLAQGGETFLEKLNEIAEAYRKSQLDPYYPGKKEWNEESYSPNDIQPMIQIFKEITDKLSSNDFIGAAASLASFTEQVNKMTERAPTGGGLTEVSGAVAQLAEIGGRLLPALALLHGKSPQDIVAEAVEGGGRLTTAGKGTGERAGSLDPADAQSILAAIAVLQETVNGLVGAGLKGGQGGSARAEEALEGSSDLSALPVIGEIAKIKDILMTQLIKNGDALLDARTSMATVDERVKNIISLIRELAESMLKNAASGQEIKWGRATEGDDTRNSQNIRIKYRPKDSV